MIHPSGVFHFRLQHLDVHIAPGPMATQVRSIVKTPTHGSVKAPPSVTLTPCKLCKIQHTDVGSAWLRPITPSSLGPAQHLRRGSSRKTRRVIPMTLPIYITRNTASRLFHALRGIGLGTRHFRCPSRTRLSLSNFLFSLLFLAQGANFESTLGSSVFLRHHIENPGACIASQARHSGAMISHGSMAMHGRFRHVRHSRVTIG